ncbi:MAG: nucleoside deaminase [Candidatus Omnitrophica bacterium]|nr:nucleoside deaminase [Candidatus Omnitrophota bacterium]MCM8790480.1 nucleoside deaminase [Candidatus Omnitrophota bacterium]
MEADERPMRLAIAEARKNLRTVSGGPFGACIVKGSRILACERNTLLRRNDATCHAEINAIRRASKKLASYDLSGCEIYATTEPCPMCFGAIHWARIDRIIYGTSIPDVRRLGFNELMIPAGKMKAEGKSKVRIEGGFLLDECKSLLKDWLKLKKRKVY